MRTSPARTSPVGPRAPAIRNADRSSASTNGKPIIAPRAATIGAQVSRVNRWREQYNPLRGITIARAVQLLETYRRGEFADLQWTYSFVEESDDDTFALVERRTSAILEMDWDVKVTPENKRRKNFDEKLAEDQAVALREAYDRIDNLYEAIEHMAMASFRGFAHCEKQSLRGQGIDHLEVVDQWNLVRDGYRGAWKYNQEARQTTFQALSGEPLPMERFLFREVNRHINRVALKKFLRTALGEKDWVAFIEIFGIPSGVVIMPPNVAAEKADEFKESATRISEGGSGALPAGSEYKPNDQPRGVNPFSAYLDYFTQKLILVGTGGLLTMLTQSGSGTLAGGAHADTFKTLAKSEARKIAQSFCRDLDGEVLDQEFPGKPRLAYWELAAQEETDTKEIVDEVLKLSQAGYQADPGEVGEKTGYTLTLKPAPAAPAPGGDGRPDAGPYALRNRQAVRPSTINPQLSTIIKARAAALQPLLTRIAALEKAADPAALRAAVAELRRALPALADEIHAQPELAQAIFDVLSEATAKAAVDELRQKGTML